MDTAGVHAGLTVVPWIAQQKVPPVKHGKKNLLHPWEWLEILGPENHIICV